MLVQPRQWGVPMRTTMNMRSLVTTSLIALAFASPARAQNSPLKTDTELVDGSYDQQIAIDVPAFRGLEPKLTIHYNSGAGNGELGVGWTLTGFSVIERTSGINGAPAYASSDSFNKDGQMLLPCAPGSASPSCSAGGNYTAK